VPDVTFTRPDLTTFCRLDELGLEVTGQRLDAGRAVLACRITDEDRWCRRCGEQGSPRDTVTRQLAHEPFGWRPTTLLVTVRRYRCAGCAHVWRQACSAAAEARAKLSRRALQWALEAIVCQHLSVARVAEGLAVSWNTANNAVLAEGQRVLIADPARFDGVAVIGVDEHVWRHTRRGDKYVTVIIDLTPIRDKTGPARLLDMVAGRSKHAFQQWLSDRPQQWRDGVEVVAMDGFSGFKTAATEELPEAVTVMDPFHVVRLAGNALDECRRRVQLATCGHRGRKTDPLYACRRTLHTGADLLTDKQRARLQTLFAVDAHAEVEATWTIYQRTVAAYRDPDRKTGRALMSALIETLSAGVPKPLQEVITLGRTLKKRAADVLAYFDRPGTSNGPTEAINGRLEHLRGSALGFRNLTNYIARSLL
jgi:transposase